jgi:hypothetical protein
MNKIVRAHYPISRLPEELRPCADPNAKATVIVEQEISDSLKRPEHVMTLEEIFAARKPPFRTKEEIDADLRRERDAWDD